MPSALRWAAVVAVAGLSLGACGGAGAEPKEPDRSRRAPASEWDPPAWTPGPSDAPRTGQPVGVATSGGYDQARAVALRVVRAVRDGDRATLERLIADRVVALFPRLGARVQRRQEVLDRALNNPRRSGLGQDVPLDELVDVEQIEVLPIARVVDDGEMPSAIQGSDLRVSFPLKPQGRRWFRFLLAWAREGGVVVRPGAHPQVVAM